MQALDLHSLGDEQNLSHERSILVLTGIAMAYGAMLSLRGPTVKLGYHEPW